MKIKTGLGIGLGIMAALLLTSASVSVFEGAARIASDRELPGTDYVVATNRFPANTMVDITNVENGKTVRAIVVFDLESASLLASVSRITAEAIGLPEHSTGRIRMTLSADSARHMADFAFPTEPELPNVATAFVVEPEWEDDIYYEGDDLPPLQLADSEGTGEAEADDDGVNPAIDAAQELAQQQEPDVAEVYTPNIALQQEPDIANLPAPDVPQFYTDEAIAEAADKAEAQTTETPQIAEAQEEAAQVATAEEEAPQVAQTPDEPTDSGQPQETPPETNPDMRYVLAPDKERIPAPSPESALPPEYFIPPITPADSIFPYDDGYAAAPPASSWPPDSSGTLPTMPPPSAYSPLQPWMVSGLERGKYYVQISASNRMELIEDEIIRIGMTYPVAIQNVGSDKEPMFRVLLGPLNSGESGAMLQRFKSIGYKDAFIRQN